MKATELMIGNWINIDGYERQVSASDIYLIYNKMFKIKPISLTEDWLVKFGAHRRSDITKFYLEGYKIAILSGKIYFNPSSTNGLSIHLKYVHQLQNLYLALKEKKLKFKKLELQD